MLYMKMSTILKRFIVSKIHLRTLAINIYCFYPGNDWAQNSNLTVYTVTFVTENFTVAATASL